MPDHPSHPHPAIHPLISLSLRCRFCPPRRISVKCFIASVPSPSSGVPYVTRVCPETQTPADEGDGRRLRPACQKGSHILLPSSQATVTSLLRYTSWIAFRRCTPSFIG